MSTDDTDHLKPFIRTGWLIGCLMTCLSSAAAVDLSVPVDVPDDIGLGERLAIIAWLGDHKIPVVDPQDLPALRLAYIKRAHPKMLVDAKASSPEQDQQRGELAAALYRKHGINPPVDADAAAITALIARLDAQSEAALARDQEKARADGPAPISRPTPPTTVAVTPPNQPRATPPTLTEQPPALTELSPEEIQLNAARAGVGIVIGKPFPVIKGRLLDGSSFSLSQWRGKVVLIDFWATWCGPCVREMPNVKTVYQAHKQNGFEIIAVSLDSDKAALQKGIAAMAIPWPQLFDGGGWKNAIAQQCVVHSIPTTFLIGKDGILVAADLHGEELNEAVKKALGGGR